MKKFYIAYLFLGIYVLKANAQCGITFPNPIANFTSTEACHGSPNNFDASSSTIASPGSITNYQWDFGGPTAMGITQSYVLPISGQQYVSLKVTSSDGCSDSITKICIVNPMPAADFTYTTSGASFISFSDLSTINSAGTSSLIALYSWDFTTDGLVDITAPNCSYLYNDSGNYNVTLCVTSNKGCKSCTTKVIHVNATNSGLNILSEKESAITFPNPANDKLFISLKNNASNFSVKIFNELGQEVLSDQTLMWQNNISEGIDVSKLIVGVYFVQVNCDGKIYSKKISKY